MYANRKYRVDIIFTNYYTSDLPYIYPTRWGFAITWWLWAIYTKIFNILESFLVDGCQRKGWTSPLEIEKCFEKKNKNKCTQFNIFSVYSCFKVKAEVAACLLYFWKLHIASRIEIGCNFYLLNLMLVVVQHADIASISPSNAQCGHPIWIS